MITKLKIPFQTIILAVLIVLLTLNFIGAYLGFIANKTILEPKFFITILEDHKIYAQLRQVLFRSVKTSLPNGEDSIPYMQKAISEKWLGQEINMLLKNFYAFAKGERNETPTISFFDFKKRVVDALDDNKSHSDRIKLVEFWFTPLPDEIRLEDFMSIDFIWGIRNIFNLFQLIPWITLGISAIIILLMYFIVYDWKELILWIGSTLAMAGLLLILIGSFSEWATSHMSMVTKTLDRIASLDIPEPSARFFLAALMKGFINPMNITGVLSLLIGGSVIYFIPIDAQ